MTVQTDFTKCPAKANSSGAGGSGGGPWAWKKRSQAFLGTFSLMILGLTLVLTWESSGSGAFTLIFAVQDPQKLIDLRLGDAVKTEALFASSGELDESGRKLETVVSVWKETDEIKIDTVDSSSSPSDVLQLELKESTVGDDAEPNEPGSALPESDSITEEKMSEMKPDPSPMPKPSKKAPSSGNALIAGDEPSETIESDLGSRSKSEVCDLTKGYWVKDETRPFYSGKECKAYLSNGFACRLMTRPDFEFEKLRWQPEECDLPSFTGNGFLHRLQNKVVAFVGDSLGREQFQSLMCMITVGKDDKSVEDVHRKWPTKWAYLFQETNTTILFHWSVSLCEVEEGHPNEEPGHSAMHLDRPASFLQKFFDQIDVLVLNTGHHWNQGKLQSNKWHRYVNGKPLVDENLAGMGNSLNFTVHNVVKWLDDKLADGSKRKPAVFFRTLSPRHFKNGDWNSGGKCDATRSHYGPNVTADDKGVDKPSRPVVYKGPITDRIAEIAVRGTRLNLLNVTHLSESREEGHISKYGLKRDSQHQDCLHWCLPGVPDVWNELLYAYLLNDPSLSPLSEDQR